MAGLTNTTRENVLEAINTCDRLGVAAFLDANGYGPSRTWQVRFNGRSYPSKAILGVAAGLTHRELQGGTAQVVPALRRLGFEVRNGERREATPEVVELARQATAAGIGLAAVPANLPAQPACYFASGSNRPAEVRGLAGVGADVGVAVPELSANAVAELVALAGTDIQVFVDSGAFSEVKFGPFRVVKAITHAEWTKRLAVYRELAAALGSQVWLVAPDMVGSQVVTLERLTRYRAELAELDALGARLLVPVQKGEATQAEFAAQVDVVLAGIRWTPALPCKKAATTAAEAAAFLNARKPAAVHLLGMGPRNQKAPAFVRAILAAGVESFTMDSNWIAANVGRGDATPRRFTAAQDLGRLAVAAGALAADMLKPFAFLMTLGAAVLGAPC